MNSLDPAISKRVFIEVSQIDTDLFICGVHALKDVAGLRNRDVSHILNVAEDNLYDLTTSNGRTLVDALEPFTVKVIGANDVSNEDLSVFFDEISDFIEEGRQEGGVVVHCAAGVSRSSTACIAYLVLKENMSVEAAFRKIFHVREFIHPNAGFWRQLRDLEAVLVERGATLRDLKDGELEPGDDRAGAAEIVLRQLDEEACAMASFSSVHVTVRVVLSPEAPSTGLADAAKAAERLRSFNTPAGLSWTSIEVVDDVSLVLRAALIASRGATAGADVRQAVVAALGTAAVASAEIGQ